MATSFATLEMRALRAALRRLSNATGEWHPGGSAAPVVGIRLMFDRESGEASGGMVNDRQASAQAAEADMPGARRGQLLSIARDAVGGVAPAARAYQIAQASPDGAGMLVLDLVDQGAL